MFLSITAVLEMAIEGQMRQRVLEKQRKVLTQFELDQNPHGCHRYK